MIPKTEATAREGNINQHFPHLGRQSHGVIPEKMSKKVLEYHQRKGHQELFEQCSGHLCHNQNVLARRRAVQEIALGEHAKNHSILPDGEVVKVYDCKNSKKLKTKKPVREGSTPSKDTTVNEAYDGAVATYNFLKDIFKIKSIDNHSYPLISFVHYDRNYNNAFWDGEQMIYGDGDGKVFNRFTILDITGHEQTHGLTQERAGIAFGPSGGIDYEAEAGGINESYSDIFGSMIKQRVLKQTARKADWIIGQGLIKKNAIGLRSMSAPGTAFKNHSALGNDTQVANYADYLQRLATDGEVDPHDSSGIVNKAFYIMATEMDGYSWEKAGKIFFDVLPKLKHNVTFRDLATLTLNQAKIEFKGEGTPEYAAVIKGWRAGGVID